MKRKPVRILFYITLIIIGFFVLFINSKIYHTDPPSSGEYYYSNFLRSNYSYISGSCLFLIGLITGFLFKANPWATGISLISIFPITAIYEATIYRGSHNLIPFELVVHFLFSLPAVIGTYLGGFLKTKN